MKRLAKNNGLSIVLFCIFALTLVGQYVSGWKVYSDNERQHEKVPVGIAEYAFEGHFIEALFENWESEFLQMAAYVALTVFLYQQGSSESKRPGVTERVDVIISESKHDPKMPWPVRRGGIALNIYENSLTIVFGFLFIASFFLHLYGGVEEYNSSQIDHGEPTVSFIEFLGTSQFWFESFQNWQSEFLSIGLMVVLTIFLRQRGSPESKPVDSPYMNTGTD